MPKLFVFTCTFLSLSAIDTFGGTINLSTGLTPTGSIWLTGEQPDANWTVNGAPAQTVYPNNIDWNPINGPWVPNGPTSTWIAINANIEDNGPAAYSFVTTFTLPDYANVMLSGNWTIDDSGLLLVNSNVVSQIDRGWASFHAFTVNPALLHPGANTIAMIVTFSDRSKEGARLDGTVVFNSTPEPTAGLMGITGLSLLGLRRVLLRR
jgi:hypothetical protein